MAEKLGSILVRKQLITPQQLEDALKLQVIYGGRVGTNLIELGYLDVETLSQALAEQTRIAAATVAEFEAASAATLACLPRELAEKHCAFPLRADGRRLVTAVASAFDFAVIDELGFSTGLRIVPRIAPELRIVLYLERRYGIERKARYIRLADDPIRRPQPPPAALAPVDRRAALGSATPSPFARLGAGEFLSGPESEDELAASAGTAAAAAPAGATLSHDSPAAPPRTAAALGPYPEDPITTARRAALLGARPAVRSASGPVGPPGGALDATTSARRAAPQPSPGTPLGRLTPGGLPAISHRAAAPSPAPPPVLRPSSPSGHSPGVGRSAHPPNGLPKLNLGGGSNDLPPASHPAIATSPDWPRTGTPPNGIPAMRPRGVPPPHGSTPSNELPAVQAAGAPRTGTPAGSVSAMPQAAVAPSAPANGTAAPAPAVAPAVAPAAGGRPATPARGLPAVSAAAAPRSPTPPPTIVLGPEAIAREPPAGLPPREAAPSAPIQAAESSSAASRAAPGLLPWDLEPEASTTPAEPRPAYEPPELAAIPRAAARGNEASLARPGDWFLAPAHEVAAAPRGPAFSAESRTLPPSAAPTETAVAEPPPAPAASATAAGATEQPTVPPTPPAPVEAPPAPPPAARSELEPQLVPIAGLFHVEEAFGRANTREKIAEALLWFAQGRFSTAVVFTVERGRAEGWIGFGPGLDPASLGPLAFELDPASVLARAASAAGALVEAQPRGELDCLLLRRLGLPEDSAHAAVAISAHGETVAVFVGSRGQAPLRETTVYELERASATAARAFERLTARRG